MAKTQTRLAERIVSLVPSVTESLFCLGLGDRVVGITDWCVHPSHQLSGLPRVGGTKNPLVRQILELEPDLVIANREENRKRTVLALRAAGVDVWVTYPQTVQDGVTLLRELAELGA
ncbi:MAG: ABC transporter substrate-binding protein, partial [Deltaproteobacteria bacterium]|nr:ABC transporter substrate-binding protein [Deltaproteobacteria bacterium]